MRARSLLPLPIACVLLGCGGDNQETPVGGGSVALTASREGDGRWNVPAITRDEIDGIPRITLTQETGLKPQKVFLRLEQAREAAAVLRERTDEARERLRGQTDDKAIDLIECPSGAVVYLQWTLERGLTVGIASGVFGRSSGSSLPVVFDGDAAADFARDLEAAAR